MSRRASFVLLLLAVALIPSASYAPEDPIAALAPFEILASGFNSLRGVAVDSAGSTYVADRDAGTVTRIAPDRGRVLVAAGLDRPTGLAFDADGRLLIAEEAGGRVVRIEADGRRTPVMNDVKQPRWLAVSETGRLFVSARRLTRDGDPEPDDESAEPEMILTLGAAGRPALFADGFKHLQGLAAADGGVYAATRGRREDTRADGAVFQIPILADGSAGPPTQLGTSDTFKRPLGLARDRLGALYLTTKELDLDEDHSKRAVGKIFQDGTVTLFAANFDDPQALAFDADGNLYVTDGRSGRVVQFRAPRPPSLDAQPAYTNQATVNVRGTTEPAARVDMVLNGGTTSVVGVADAAGAFGVSVTLASNTAHVLEMFATGHAGEGLTSSPTEARITHDGIPPSLAFQAPPAGAFVRQTVPVATLAGDGGSGLGGLALRVGAEALAGTVAPSLPAPAATVTATWNTVTSVDGAQTLVASAVDQAGNNAAVSRPVIVDNTAPDTRIAGGPAGTVQATGVTFAFGGTDNLTPATSLAFAWRLDGGPWSAFDSDTSATIAGLTAGPHLFEVKARDLAGNEDPTPAQASFTVGGLRLAITDPTDGATVPAGLTLVRGMVEAGGVEVGITVNGIVALVQGTTFAAEVPVTTETASLAALATTVTGEIANHTIALSVSSTTAMPVLQATPATGIAPLTVAFSVAAATEPAEVELDADGDGRVDLAGPDLHRQTFLYAHSGLYLATATITDGQGGKTTVRTLVQVYDRASLDAMLRTKWTGLKAALRTGDVGQALEAVARSARDDYRDLLTALGSQLANIDAILTDISAVAFYEDAAEYHMIRVDGGVRLSYFVLFVRDGDGIWRLKFF